MTFIKAVSSALLYVIQWVTAVYSAFCEWIGISEWVVLFTAIVIIGTTIGIKAYKRSH